jgi:hypothetical protein
VPCWMGSGRSKKLFGGGYACYGKATERLQLGGLSVFGQFPNGACRAGAS